MSSEDDKHKAYLQSIRGALLPQLQASIAGASSLTSERYRKSQAQEHAVAARKEREAAEKEAKGAFELEKEAQAKKLERQKEKNKKKKKAGRKRQRGVDEMSSSGSID